MGRVDAHQRLPWEPRTVWGMSMTMGRKPGAYIAPAAIGLVVVLLLACGAAGMGPLVAYLVSITAVTFLAYGFDKQQGANSSWRVPEVVLHGLTLAGGTLGALGGQVVFRHKTRKSKFRAVFTVIVGLQLILVIIWVLAR